MAKDVVKAFLSMPFGKSPEEKVYWEGFESGIVEVAKLFTDPLLEIHSAIGEVSALDLKENVKQLIDKCDITIAIITRPNPNIFWEVGYSQAQRKPVVFLVDEEATDLAQSPVLIIEALKFFYRSSMFTTLARDRKLAQDFARRLKPFLDKAIYNMKARPVEPTVKVFGDREACHLPSLVATAASHIYLITTNLSYFADFNRFVVVEGSENMFAFDSPVEKRVDVRILTLDPDSSIVKYRAEQLGFDHNVGRYREELRSSARKFYERYKNKANVNIKLYDDLPLQITLMVDDQVMTSVMSRGCSSRLNLHFLLSINTPGAKRSFEKHFYEVGAAPSKHISTFGWAAGSTS